MWPALTCELCGRRFRGSLAKFHRHRQTHREQNAGIGFLSCLACGFETDDAAEFSEHACGRGEAPAEPAEDLYWYCQSWQRAGNCGGRRTGHRETRHGPREAHPRN